MCTAVSWQGSCHCFGRNLDLEGSFAEAVTITPRAFPLPFRRLPTLTRHLALIGMAYVSEGYPLYYDATNEAGLSMAGLNFPGFACYQPEAPSCDNVTPFELIPWILGQCATLAEAKAALTRVNLLKESFSSALPLTPLHWILADRSGSVVVEPLESGLRIHENPVGVMTNSPPFDFHMTHLCSYMALGADVPENRFAPQLSLEPYSRGMGAMGLPGDLSSASRFVKAAFTRLHALPGQSEAKDVSQFFHILTSVEQQRGCVRLSSGAYEFTVYSSCCNTDRGIYYYTTYENRQITAVELHRENLESAGLISYPLLRRQQIFLQNG